MTQWQDLEASFSSVTLTSTNQTGTVIDFGNIEDGYLMYLAADGVSGDQITVSIQASVDNARWYDAGMSLTTGTLSSTQAWTFIGTGNVDPARYIRAQGSAASGAPVVTAKVARRLGD